MFVPPMMDEGTEMFHGVEGAVLVETVPSSDTQRVEGKIKAGRTPQVFWSQTLLSQEPSVRTVQAVSLLTVYGERSHHVEALLPLYATRLLLPPEPLPK